MQRQLKQTEDFDVEHDVEHDYFYEADNHEEELTDINPDSKRMDQFYRDRYEQAKKRVGEIRDFYAHVAVYICAIGCLTIFDWLEDGNLDFAHYVTLFWGIAVIIHFGSVYGETVFLGRDWEARKIRQLMGEDEKPKRRG